MMSFSSNGEVKIVAGHGVPTLSLALSPPQGEGTQLQPWV